MAIFGRVIPSMPSLSGILHNPIWVIAILMTLAVLALFLHSRLKKRGRSYKATIWERVGQTWRKRYGLVVEKRDKTAHTYSVYDSRGLLVFRPPGKGKPSALTLDDAVLTSRGRAEFDLIKISGYYFPASLPNEIKLKSRGEKDGAVTKLSELLNVEEFYIKVAADLDQVERAQVEAVEDNKNFMDMDRWAPLFQTLAWVAPIVFSLILVWYAIGKVGDMTMYLPDIMSELSKASANSAEAARVLSHIAERMGIATAAPPG
jgi:hypothetical protein